MRGVRPLVLSFPFEEVPMFQSMMRNAALSLSAAALWGCGSGDPDVLLNQNALYSQNTQCTTLYAGQTINAGSVCVSVGGEDLVVSYATTNGWELNEAHLWVGDDLSTMPQTKTGNPQIGNFPYKAEGLSGATSYTFTIPLSSLGDGSLCGHSFSLAAHAALRKDNGSGGYQTETGWGSGSQINSRGSWATYFTYTVACEGPPPPPPALSCETAFALGNTTLIQLGVTQSRWGWQNGPLVPGSYSFPIYAGAAQNDTSKGTLVGQLSVDYDGSTANVGYAMSAGYVLDETHLYVGTSNVTTVSPGQLGNTHDLSSASSDSFSVGGFSGQPIYVVAHAVSCR
jgi:hypothetical protein